MNDAAALPRSLRARMARGVAVLALVGAALVIALVLRDPYPPLRTLALTRGSGWLAALALLASLSVGPASRLSRALGLRWPAANSGGPAALRRALGIACAWLALLHAGGAFFFHLRGTFALLATLPQLKAGVGALGLLCLLLLTSFGSVVRALRLHHWKELHRLSYIAALLVALHIALSAFATLAYVGAWLGVLLIMLTARAWLNATRRS